MNPETGNIYVLLFNDKLIEMCLKPTPEFLLRSYGKTARVLKIKNEDAGRLLVNGEHAITIDYHRGFLLLATSNRLLGWNITRGTFGKGIVTSVGYN